MAKSFSVLAGACLLAAPAAALAETPTLYLASYGGSTEVAMKEQIIPAFEKEHNVDVVYIPGNSTDTLAKLQAQKGAQEIDVILVDDGPMYQAVTYGYCDTLKPTPTLDTVYDLARLNTDKAVGIGFVVTGLAYSEPMFKENGWAPPASWKDLEDKKYQGKLVVPPINVTYGLQALVMMARLNGGGLDDIDPGFDAFIDRIGPNVLAYEPSPGKISELFQNGEIAMAVWGSGRVKALQDTGYEAGFVYPEEGGLALMVASCPIVGSDVPDEAQAFVNYLLTPDVQTILAKAQGWGPTNKTVDLPADLADAVPYGPEKIEKLIALDWEKVNSNRAEWTNRWNRTVER